MRKFNRARKMDATPGASVNHDVIPVSCSHDVIPVSCSHDDRLLLTMMAGDVSYTG